MKNPRPMRDAVSRLTDKEYRFIRKEFGITKKELLHLSEDLLIELYDELSSIEATLSAAKGRASWSYMIIGLTPFLYLHSTMDISGFQDGICNKIVPQFLFKQEKT